MNNFHTYLRFLQEHVLSFQNVVLRCDTLDGYISIMDHVQNFYGEYELCFTAVELPVTEHVVQYGNRFRNYDTDEFTKVNKTCELL